MPFDLAYQMVFSIGGSNLDSTADGRVSRDGTRRIAYQPPRASLVE
jgi:hypothetical protein